MHKINNVISCYQQRIGKYDKQVWEQTIEQEVLKRLRSVPRKTAKVNPDLIDVDLFRGSAFSASKPNHGWVAITRMALLRTLFLPLYFRWWKSCAGVWLFGLLCLLYIFQVITLCVFIGNSEEDRSVASLSPAHAICPCVMMFVLALIHTQMMSAAESSPQYSRIRPSNKRDVSKKPSKASASRPASERERDSGGSHDTGIDLNPEDVRVSSAGSRRPPENKTSKLHKTTKPVPEDTSQDCHDNDKVRDEVITGVELTSDIASAFEKTCDWVRKLSPSHCEVPQMTDDFDSLSRVHVDELLVSTTDLQSPADNQSVVAPDLCVSGNDFSENKQFVAECEATNSEPCNLRSFEEEIPKPSFGINLLEDKNCHECFDANTASARYAGGFGKTSPETESIANSNGSLSDAAESSLISSVNDINWREDGEVKPSRYHMHRHSADNPAALNLGVRHRNTAAVQDCQMPDDDQMQGSSKVKGHGIKAPTSRSFGAPFSTARSGGGISKDFLPGDKAPGWRSISFVSSEEEFDKRVRAPPFRPPSSRKISLNQTAKGVDKPFGRSASEMSKGGSLRGDSRTQPKVKIIDTRQLESTGISSCESDCEDRVCKGKTSPKATTSEWEDTINTNTEMTSPTDTSSAASSASDLSEKDIMGSAAETSAGQGIQHASSVMNNLASNTDRVSCMIWEPNSVHKVDLTVMDIGWTIIQRVDKMNETLDYLILGIIFSLLLMFTPVIYRGYHSRDQLENLNYLDVDDLYEAAKIGFGQNWRVAVVIINGMVQRLCLSILFFFLLSVSERTFKQRLLYAKNFCYLTSSRRAKKYDLPHFRLNKVRNIKTWLSLRCFLKKRGPQRTVDSIVSAAFLLSVILLSILCIELLQGYGNFLDHLSNWELVIWCMSIGIYLLRFITLGTKINKKYRNFSVLITEQINLYLHMEQKPHKKEELMVANSVLKLAEDLLKELESPFKISGLSANPFLYNITKVVVLSAFSAVLTELLGFKLKLYKIKIRS